MSRSVPAFPKDHRLDLVFVQSCLGRPSLCHADLVEKLPARVAPAHVALRDDEKALTLASLLPELSDRSFFRGVRAVGDMGAFVLDDKPAAIFQLGDEVRIRSEEHTSDLQSLMRISYA